MKNQTIDQLVANIQMDTRDDLSVAIDAAKELISIISSGAPFEFYGIQEAGLAAKAWKLVARGEEFEDARQQILVEAVQLVRDNDPAAQQGGGYLLQKAYWNAINVVRRQNHTYMVVTHNVSIESLDADDFVGHAKVESIPAPMVDQELRMAVKTVVYGMDKEDRTIAEHLMSGYKKSEIANLLGVTPAAISYRVRRIKKQLEEVVNI